jgi:hypothetical protein
MPLANEVVGTSDAANVLGAALALWDDFLENGPFYVKEVALDSRASGGTIDWRRTESRSLSVLMEGSPIYMEPVYRIRRHDLAGRFFLLHLATVQSIGSLLGLDSGLQTSISLAEEFHEYAHYPERIREDFSSLAFRDRARQLTDLISAYCGGLPLIHAEDDKHGSTLFGVTNFERVWEHMLRTLLSNMEGREFAKLQAGEWFCSQSGQPQTGIRPITDGCFLREDNGKRLVFLFDAKERDELASEGVTGSPNDHYKQMFYARLLELTETDQLYNVLIFPKLSGGQDPYATVLGSHSWPAVSGSQVFEVAVSYEETARAFAGLTSWDSVMVQEQLIEVLRNSKR